MFKTVSKISAIILLTLSFLTTSIEAATTTVKKSVPGSWSAKFDVNYSSSKISSITHLKVSTTVGTHTVHVKKLSDTSYNVVITRHIYGLTTTTKIHAQIKSGKLVTSVN